MGKRTFLGNLHLGQRVFAKVERVISDDEFMANLDGYYIKISNQSTSRLSSGQRVELLVASIFPLRFRLVQPKLIGHDLNLNI